jgi:2'-5' RNA ligase
VAKERLKSPRARLFVALDLPDDVRGEIVAWQQRELTDEALRPTAPENLHVTLAFLGYQRERDIEAIAKLVAATRAPAPRMRLAPEPVTKGRSRKRPSLIALDAPSEEAVALQAELETSLVDAGFYEPEKRAFWPHVSVARVRPERRGSKRPMEVTRMPGPFGEGDVRTFDSVRISLYRSNLRPQGAEYLRLASTDLKVS